MPGMSTRAKRLHRIFEHNLETGTLTCALAAAGLLCGAAFQATAQRGGDGGRGGILSMEDRTAVQGATREQMTRLRADLQAAQGAAIQAALSEDATYRTISSREGRAVVKEHAAAIRGRTEVRLLVGDQDRLLAVVKKYDQLLASLNIEHQFAVAPGADHSEWQILQSLPFDGFAFWKTAFAQTQPTPSPS